VWLAQKGKGAEGKGFWFKWKKVELEPNTYLQANPTVLPVALQALFPGQLDRKGHFDPLMSLGVHPEFWVSDIHQGNQNGIYKYYSLIIDD
jgi:hypothetical protein